MYLGLHFPGDILAGLIWGGTVASLVYYFYHRLTRKSNPAKRLVSSKYTVTGYMRSDCDLPVEVFVFTLLFALILACFI